MTLPTANEINPIREDLDGKVALDHFLGTSHDEAVALFADAFEIYQEDLLFMGPVAFRFYLPAAIQYADSSDAATDAYVAGTMLMVMKHRWEFDRKAIDSARDSMLRYCEGVLERLATIEVDPDVDGDLGGSFRDFVDLLRGD
jgi:hypothetical protein